MAGGVCFWSVSILTDFYVAVRFNIVKIIIIIITTTTTTILILLPVTPPPHRHQELWLVELVYDTLRAWNDWAWRHRRLLPLNLMALGSTPHPWAVHDDDTVGTVQGAR
jgi:hypothetical protein